MPKEKLIEKDGLYYPTDQIKKEAWINDLSIYKTSTDDPLKFWADKAQEIYWHKKWDKVFEYIPPRIKWFVNGKLNITYNCLDLNLKEKGEKTALIWEPEPVDEKERRITYRELFEKVNKLANALKNLGAKKGDCVGIYMPMIPETIISMLACSRIGAVHTVVFSAFSPNALNIRLRNTKAKILITADGYFRRGKLINLKKNADLGIKGTSVEKVVVVRRAKSEVFFNPSIDVWYHDVVKGQSNKCNAEIMDAEDTQFILYTSGSTGKPKGCVHVCGGYTVQAKITGKWIFDLKDTDIFWSTADVGWITGHTYTVYSPFLNGATVVIFEGTPDWPNKDRWAKIIKKYKVTIFYTAPTAIRMFEKYGLNDLNKEDLSTLRLLGTVGEPIDEAAWQVYFKEVGRETCPILDTWWQTETGGILITSLPGIGPFKPSYTGLPFPGIKVDIWDDLGNSLPANKKGNLVILPPFAPSLLRGVYKNPAKYYETYWKKYKYKAYFTSDAAIKDKNGLIRIVGRLDDVIKVAGHRLSTGEMEDAVNKHPDVTECAVIGISDEIKGEVPAVFVVLDKKRPLEEIKKEVIKQVREGIGPIATPKEVFVVDDLPKTRSGKIMRRIIKRLWDREDLGDLSTLANPQSVSAIKTLLS